MDSELYNRIKNSTAHRKSREENRDFIVSNPLLIPEIIQLCFSTQDKNHHKACWILELVVELNSNLLFPFANKFIEKIHFIKNESALRSISGIILQLVQEDFKKNTILITLSDLKKITTSAFDWLINDCKVATKAHAMKILYFAGKKQNWIYPELKMILTQDAHKHSVGYKSCAKNILQKIK